MFIHDLFEQQERRLVVVYPGRFQPFHLGHLAVFQQLQGRFGRDNVYVGYCSAQRKKESKGDPKYFDGAETRMFMHAVGIDDDRIKDISGADNNFMYGAAGWSKVVPFDPENTVLILAIGEPDADKLELDARYTEFTPTGKRSRIPPGKQVGDEKPLKTLPKNLAECNTADQFSYVTVVPEVHKQIEIGGEAVDVSHGRLVRAVWNRVRKNAGQRAELLQQMFGRNDAELGRILDKIPAEVIKESINTAKKKHLTENDDDMFADSSRLANLKNIIGDFEYISQKMIEDPIAYAAEQGWDDDDIDDKIIDDVMTAGHEFSELADTFKRNGMGAGLQRLLELGRHDNDAVVEAAAEAIEEIRDQYGIDINQYINENDDDLFAASNRAADQIRRAKHPFADLGVDYDNYDLFMDLLLHCVGLVNTRPDDRDEMADVFLWILGQNYGGAAIYDVIDRVIHNRAGGDINNITKQLHDALIADHQQGYLKPVDAVAKLDGILGQAMYAVEDVSNARSKERRQDELDESDDDLFAEPRNKVHDLSDWDDSTVYDITQSREDIKSGDILKLDNNRWAIMVDFYPVMVVGDSNSLHKLDTAGGHTFSNIEGGRFAGAAFRAQAMANKNSINENDDDLFAPTRAERISNTLMNRAAEMKADWAGRDPSWDDHWTVEEETAIYNYVRRLAEIFRSSGGLIKALNVMAHALNDVECPTYKRSAIWDIDEYLGKKMGASLDDLFQEYEDQLDESAVR